jgi:hypothetical protein
VTARELAGADLRTLIGDLAAEIANKDLGPKADPPREVLALLAVDLHSYYTALESLVERVLVAVEGRTPGGPASHAALLREASRAIEGVRPSLFPPERIDGLDELRRFRHVFRHAYALDLRHDKMRRALDPFPAVHAGLSSDLDALIAFLRRLIDEIEKS